jgi:CRP-like cAMP-binding protein
MSGDAIDKLRAIPIFSQLDDQALTEVASIAGRIDVAKGSVLIERGQPGSGMFVILEGTVGVELRQRTVELGPGEFIGELSLLTDDAQRSARVRATTDVTCLTIGRSEFASLLGQHPRIAVPMLSELARRLLGMIDQPA